MAYPASLLCVALLIPAFGLAAVIDAILLIAAGPRDGWSVFINILAFFGAGIQDPLRYGWRIVAFLAVFGLFLIAEAITSFRIPAFSFLAIVGTLCAAFSRYMAVQQDCYNGINALIVLSPSFLGIVACLWFAAQFNS